MCTQCYHHNLRILCLLYLLQYSLLKNGPVFTATSDSFPKHLIVFPETDVVRVVVAEVVVSETVWVDVVE